MADDSMRSLLVTVAIVDHGAHTPTGDQVAHLVQQRSAAGIPKMLTQPNSQATTELCRAG